MGHALHRYYSNKNQDYYYSDNAIFVAEIASTVNETLLNLYMLDKENEKMKKLIINELLDDIKNTIYRQTMFAEFELTIHNMSFNGETLNNEKLNNIYYDLIKNIMVKMLYVMNILNMNGQGSHTFIHHFMFINMQPDYL